MTFMPLFWQITYLSLSFATFRVSRFPVSHLTHETVKLGLQNTLNMSKTTRVYFGVLHCTLGRALRTKETLPDFRELCRVTPTFTSIPRVNGFSTDPLVLGRHTLIAKLNIPEKMSINESELKTQ